MNTLPPKESSAKHIESFDGDQPEDNRISSHAPLEKPTKCMILFACYISISAMIYNFDLGYSGIVLLMQPFNAAFATCRPTQTADGATITKCTLTALEQGLTSLSILFIGLGATIGGFIGNYLGRRGTIQVGALVTAIGAAGMLGTKGNYTAYLACKSIQSVGLGHIIGAVPQYGVECISASRRGLLMALFNVGLGIGNASAAAVCLGTSHIHSDASWRIPIACQLPLSLLMGVGTLCFPESPRWLLTRDRHDEARKSFATFLQRDSNSPEVTRQLEVVQRYLRLEKQSGATTNWTEIFHGIDRRRTLTSTGILVGSAVVGSKFIQTYAAIFLAGVGFRNPYHITLVVAGCIAAGGICSPIILETLGRRYSLLSGYTLLGLAMMIIATIGSTTDHTKTAVQGSLTGFLCLWGFTYGGFIATSVPVTAPEMHAVGLRTYGHAFATTVYEIFSFAASFSTPYMLSTKYGNMGTNVGYFFLGLSIAVGTFCYFFVPETGKLTLEEVDDIFLSRTPAPKTSYSKNKATARARTYTLGDASA
ncbi:hypothetical protein LTR84_008278 [Exophiala bonariae]|uniref:Major facilitator superfamily (MFS) profile domain-containing protein n=1 Tax=Exophiala bonariae TaxID=1690606 RepID=A0AAV9N0Y1_9EURO|nr:hypothetical protein LTR84_008278 [Exophiala bonariae]